MIGNHQIRYLLSIVIIGCSGLLIACDDKNKIMVPGYIEGQYTYIAPAHSGILNQINVKEGDTVNINQQLFTLEAQPETSDLQAALARMQEANDQAKKAQSHYHLAKTEFDRKVFLFKKNVSSKAQLDTSTSTYLQADAEMQASQANFQARKADFLKAQWDLQQKVLRSPINATVIETYYSPGEFIPAGRPVLSLLAPAKIKIIFFLAESFLSQIKLNKQIDITCDECKKNLTATITFIAKKAEYTPPIIYSTEQRAKLVYRIEALPVDLDVHDIIHPGQPVSVIIRP